MTTPVVIGLDGGGTYTRALCADLAGNVLAQAQTGGANPSKNADAEQNVQGAIRQVLALAHRAPAAVVGLVAGIAGLDAAADQVWAEKFTTVPGLTIQPHCVNDAVVAWAGALALQPGIIVIAGTGCVIFGVTERGRQVRNYDFSHYADATARNLTFNTVFRILAGETSAADQELVGAMLAHFGVATQAALAEQAAQNDHGDYKTVIRAYGAGAPLVTAAAERGVPLACAVCSDAAKQLAQGVRLLGSLFTPDPIPYALIGSVARSAYVQRQLNTLLATPTNHSYRTTEPLLPPAAGAILLALQRHNVPIDQPLLQRIKRSLSGFTTE